MPQARQTSVARFCNIQADKSGSWDGHIRLWALDPLLRQFKPLQSIPVPGFINSIQLLSVPAASVDSGSWGSNVSPSEVDADIQGQQRKDKDRKEILLVAAVATEPRLGRWMSERKGVKSGVFVAHLRFGEKAVETEVNES